MMFRKLLLVFAIVAGLCSFDTPVESARLPQVAQTELVISSHKEQQQQERRVVFNGPSEARKDLLVVNEITPVSFYQIYHRSLLVDTQHYHASL